MTSPRDRYATYPISAALWGFADAEPLFKDGMKLWSDRFHLLPILICSRLPPHVSRHDDQVIGFWYLDIDNLKLGKSPRFKQDLVVNIGGRGEEFIVYTSPSIARMVNSPFVRALGDFTSKYGRGGQYYCRPGRKSAEGFHHFNDASELPPEIRPWGEAAERLYQ